MTAYTFVERTDRNTASTRTAVHTLSGPDPALDYVIEIDQDSDEITAAYSCGKDDDGPDATDLPDADVVELGDLIDAMELDELRKTHPQYAPTAAALEDADRYIEDYETGLADGTYEDRDGYDRAVAARSALDMTVLRLCQANDAASALLAAFGGNVPDWLRDEARALSFALRDARHPAIAAPTIPDDHPILAATAAGFGVVESYIEDQESGLDEGIYEERDGLDAAVADKAAAEASIRKLCAVYDASRALLDAFGGDTPDWIRKEAIRLDGAIEDAAACAPAPDAASPAP